MNQSQNASFQAGQTKGQSEEKASQLLDKASNAVHSAQQSCQEAGGHLQAKAEGAVETVKSSVGSDKSN